MIGLCINGLLVRLLSESATSTSGAPARALRQEQILTAQNTIEKFSQDICATVPFFLGDPAAVALNGKQQYSRAAAGTLVLWPLYVAAETGYCTVELRSWITLTLRKVADVTGIRQASIMADKL